MCKYVQNGKRRSFAVSLQPLCSLILVIILMFRKQKAKEQLLVIGQYGSLRAPDSQRIRNIKITDADSSKAKGRTTPSALIRIYSQDSSIAVIDKNQDAWLIAQPFSAPINLSSLLRKKIERVFLGEKELIVQASSEYILVNWGSIKALQGSLMRISTYSSCEYESLFVAYLITSAEIGSAFHYSLEKKMENSNRLYQIRGNSCKIIAHPTLTTINTARPIKGVSVGKHHSLCWDHQGGLYSWGCRSLGLGYGHLPSEDLVEQPRKVKLAKHVLMAFAATHYSLALTSQGVLYEWGIKAQFNQINEEPIFDPRPLDFRFFRCNAKFVSLKGRENNFAALASTGELYVWGLNARHLLAPNIQLPPSWLGSHIYQPVLQTDLLPYRVRDFSIELSFVSVVLGTGEEEPEEEYWQVLKEKARNQLASFKSNRIRTQTCQHVSALRRKYKNPILGEYATERKQPSIVKIDIKSTFKPPSQRRIRQKHQSLDHNAFKGPFKKTAPLSSTCWPNLNLTIHKRQVSDFFGYSSPIGEAINLRCSQIGLSCARREEVKKFSQNYSIRLQGVLQKKQKLENLSLATNLKRIDQSEVEYKLKKRQEEEARKKYEEDEDALRSGLLPFFIKSYLIKFMTEPLQEGRNALIASFSRSLVLVRVEKNIKRLFIDAKIKFSMMALQKDRFPRYALLALYFKNYVIKFRARRAEKLRAIAIRSLVVKTLKEKMKNAVERLTLPVGRIAKMGQWLIRHNKARLRILKQLWNNFVLVTLKPTDGGQINLHVSPQATYRQRFQAAVQAKTIGTLDQYCRGAVRMSGPRKTTKKSMNQLKRRTNIRFAQEFRLSSAQILPYSLHYNSLRRPKHLQISLGETAKTNSFWIQVQRKTLAELLRGVLQRHDREFYIKQREYELQLANYLKQRYDTFYELRWRFIIEYNKVERTAQKRRREKQLRRLLCLVGMQRLVDEDCIPEKSLVLEEALRRRDSPRPPNGVLQFDLSAFEGAFKSYWESLYGKAKQLRKKNL